MPADNRRPMRLPRKPSVNLSNGADEGGGHSCLLPLILLLIVGGAIGTYVYLHYTGFRKEEEPREEVQPVQKPETPLAPEPVVKPVEPVVVEPEPPPPPPKKTVAELKAEADAAQKDLDAKIAEARLQSEGKEIPGFAGARFGAVAKGVQITTEKLSGGGIAESGYGVALRGPALKSPIRPFVDSPTLWVTPKTYQVYRIELSQPLKRTPGTLPDPETTNLVATLAQKLRRDPLCLDPEKYPLGRREYTFPFGRTTLKVCECGGGVLKLIIEDERMLAKVKAESDEMRKARLAKPFGDKALSSDKYPSSGSVKLGGVRLKKGTPRHFCGFTFGALAPRGSKVSRPLDGPCAFFVDYRRYRCRPFVNFDHGRVETARSNDAIVAVDLHSEGTCDGLTEEEYYANVRKTLETRYKATPAKTEGEGPMPTVVYSIGDVDLTFGPEPTGGFRLRAENTVLSALW